MPISATNPGSLVSARGTWDCGSVVRLSTPAIGDITGEGNNEVVVTARGGTIYLVDENEMSLVDSANDSDWYFEGEDSSTPPTGAALADIDDDGDLEIFVLGATAGVGSAADYGRSLAQTMFRFDWDGSGLEVLETSDAVPYSQRTFSTSTPVGTPVIGEIDPDGTSFRPDAFANATSGAIFGFEENAGWFYSKDEGGNGWPLLHGSTVRGLTLAAMLPSVEPEQASLVGMGEDGIVHVYDFRMQDGDPPEAHFLWPSEGFDLGNTRGNLSFGGSPRAERSSNALTVRRDPDRSGVVFAVEASEAGTATLYIYDVGGRMVDRVDRQITTAGSVEIVWAGVTRGGLNVASGVYFYSVALSNEVRPLGSGKIALVR